MSSTGQALGYIAGGIIGAFIPGGYVLLGAAIGGMVGGYLDPPKGPKIEGPRLSDLAQQAASYGAPIPRIYGACSMYGNVFWIENNALTEHSATESSGGKGAPSQESTTYSYTGTFALGLCEGEVEAISRIWINGKLYFSGSATDYGTIIASNDAASTFAFYGGSASQGADPRMQAALGVANTPAYRGLCYLVFYDLPMADYGNTIAAAQIKVELFKSATSRDLINYNTLPVSADWYDTVFGNYEKGHGFVSVRFNNTNAYSQDGANWISGSMPSSLSYRSVAYGNGVYISVVQTSTTCAVSRNGKDWLVGGALPSPQSWNFIHFNGAVFLVFAGLLNSFTKSIDGGASWDSLATNPLPRATIQWSAAATRGDGLTCVVSAAGTSGGSYRSMTLQDGVFVAEGTMPDYLWWDVATNGSIFIAVASTVASGRGWFAISSDGLSWTSAQFPNTLTHQYPRSICYGSGVWLVASYDAPSATTGNLFASVDDGVTWRVVEYFPSFGPSNIAFDGAYFIVTGLKSSTALQVKIGLLEAELVYLSQVIRTEATKSKVIENSDIDTSTITDLIQGYRIAEVASIRSSIEPLRGAWPFDVVPSGYQIKFIRRGSLASVATIVSDDLGAVAEGSEPAVRITKTREMDTQLPQRVTITYLDAGREYDLNEQYAERLNTDSVSILALDMSIVMASDFAAQRAETLLYVYWLERYDVSFTLPPTYLHLEPGDIVTVVTGGGTYTLRLTEINYLPDGILECSAKFNDNAVYTSTAVGSTGTFTPSIIQSSVMSVVSLLDIPLLSDDLNRPGFPVAMAGYVAGWPGGSLYVSADLGVSWTLKNGFLNQSTIGYANGVIGAPENTAMVSAGGVIDVPVYGGKTLSSITHIQMLNGMNHFAYGRNGAWEIIAAQTCTLQADGSYVLSDLLRGRFGTEWASLLHQNNDSIILLDVQTLQFVALATNQIGIDFDYKAVTSGRPIDSADSQTMAYSGVNFKCLSPVYLNGSRHPSTRDWTLTWIRRTRIGGEWRDYVDATLGETSEAYEIDVFSNGTYTTLKRTISAVTQTAAYSSAAQVTDFGSNQATLYVRVYQLSATVGRGYPLQTSITRG